VFAGEWPLLELMCNRLSKMALGCTVCLSFIWLSSFVSIYIYIYIIFLRCSFIYR
jgi:hypothetical protein